MSDLLKVAEMAYQDNLRREFKFESKLSRWLKETMCLSGVTRSEWAKASGLSVVKLSEYIFDYTLLTDDDSVKIANGCAKLIHGSVTAEKLQEWQSVGVLVNMVEQREKWDELLTRIGVNHE